MDSKELDKIIEKHKKWIMGFKDGEKADLRGADLRGVDLRGVNLFRANLCGADLCLADLSGADLCLADLSGADLCLADFSGADLRLADLSGADLRLADLSGADLRATNLFNVNLFAANLSGAMNVPYIPLICPEEGGFIGFKKVKNFIIKLLIPADAKRSSATTRKCRCSYAKVLDITELDGSKASINIIINNNYTDCIYKVGEYVYPDSFDEDRWNECSNGIHFFIDRQEAVNY